MLAASILCILTLALEEFFLRRSGLGRDTPLWLSAQEASPAAMERSRRLVQRYRLIKFLQFLSFALLWVLAGGRAGRSLMTSSFGQVTTQLLLMQAARALGRKVFRKRTFLGVLGLQQGALALVVPFLAPAPLPADVQVSPIAWLGGLSLSFALLAMGMAFTAAVVYFIRLSPAGERVAFSDLPALHNSESLVRGAMLLSLPCLAVAAALTLFSGQGGLQPIFAICISGIPAVAGRLLHLDGRRLHHPAANGASVLAYLTLLGFVLGGLTDLHG
jgi:hypothetical protein